MKSLKEKFGKSEMSKEQVKAVKGGERIVVREHRLSRRNRINDIGLMRMPDEGDVAEIEQE